jgi:hypothetical protein
VLYTVKKVINFPLPSRGFFTVYLWTEHVVKAGERSLERDAAEEEDGEDDVGEDGRHVHHVPRGGNALHHPAINILLGPEKRNILGTPTRHGGPPGYLEENDPAGRVLLVMVSLECFPCVRIFQE